MNYMEKYLKYKNKADQLEDMINRGGSWKIQTKN